MIVPLRPAPSTTTSAMTPSFVDNLQSFDDLLTANFAFPAFAA